MESDGYTGTIKYNGNVGGRVCELVSLMVLVDGNLVDRDVSRHGFRVGGCIECRMRDTMRRRRRCWIR